MCKRCSEISDYKCKWFKLSVKRCIKIISWCCVNCCKCKYD